MGTTLPRPVTRADLHEAPLEGLLAYWLTLSDEDPIDEILTTVHAELQVAGDLAVATKHAAYATAIDGMRRRLEVATELRRRETIRTG